MNEALINMFLLNNKRYLPSSKMLIIKEKLRRLDDSRFDQLLTVEFKDPISVFLYSIFFGAIGVDRFVIGSIGIGILKLITCLLIFPYFIDLFFIQSATKKANYRKLEEIIG